MMKVTWKLWSSDCDLFCIAKKSPGVRRFWIFKSPKVRRSWDSKSPEVRRFLNSHRIILVFYTQEIVLKNSSTRSIEVLIHAVYIIRMRVVWCFGGSDSPLFRMHAKSPEVRRFRIFKSPEVRWFWVSKPLNLLRFFTPHNYLLWFLVETKVLKKSKIMEC